MTHFVLQPEAFAPRNEAERFRIYRLGADRELQLVATAPDPFSVGLALDTLGKEGEFEGFTVGVLDTHGKDEGSGTWVTNPFPPRSEVTA
jgi:hypothetical protein